MGRVRDRAEVPVDDAPRPVADRAPPSPPARPGRGRARRGRDRQPRRDGVGRHVRPHRRRVRPLLRRPGVARAALREDALRPGAARPRLQPRGGGARPAPLAPGRRRVPIEYVLRDLRLPGGGLLLGRGRRLPRRGRPQPRGPVPHVDARRGRGPCSTATPMRRSTWYDITDAGNFGEEERRSIPNRIAHRGDWMPSPPIEASRQRLFDAREERARPGLDDKVVTEWNALMISTLAEAGVLLGRAAWVDAASDATPLPARGAARRRSALVALVARRRRTARPSRRAGRPTTLRCVDAFTRLGEATGEATWIYEAMDAADELLDHFWDADQGGLFTTPDDGETLDRAPEGALRQRPAVGELHCGRRPDSPRRLDRRGPLRQPRRPHPGADRHR